MTQLIVNLEISNKCRLNEGGNNMMSGWLLLLLICPLMMIFMMKGMHETHENSHSISKTDFDELKKQNEQLSQELSEIKSKLK